MQLKIGSKKEWQNPFEQKKIRFLDLSKLLSKIALTFVDKRLVSLVWKEYLGKHNLRTLVKPWLNSKNTDLPFLTTLPHIIIL